MTAGLRTFDASTLKSIFEPPAAAEAVDAAAELDADHTLRRVSRKRQMLHMLHVANAAKQLGALPGPEESVHCVMRGNYHGWDLVPAVIRLAAPATIAELYVATLGFNGTNAAELLELVDAGTIAAVTFLCSCYFQGSSAPEFERLSAGLARRGHRCMAARSHAKILLCRLTDGRAIVVESSANLRSCRNVEQFCMTQSVELYEFHRGWINEIFNARKKAKAHGHEDPGREPRQAEAQPQRAPARRRADVPVAPGRRRKARVVPPLRIAR